MADDTDQSEKTEEATPRRREKAREEGKVARSRELTTFTMLLGGVLGLWTMGGYLYQQTGLIMQQAFSFDRRGATQVESMLTSAAELSAHGLVALMPLFLFMAVLALVSPMLLGGFLMSAQSLNPQWSRLNPVQGLKRIFSTQSLAELAKVIAKIVLLASVAAIYLASRLDDFMALLSLPVTAALAEMLRLAAETCGAMVLALVVVILIDVPFQLWNHSKQLRMTKEEVRREHKDAEGDPHLKARIRGQQQSMARRRMMSNIPGADVVVTNPTHYAVALKYDEKSMAAPRVVAKGADAVAARIRALAAEHDVPVLEAPPVARALYRHVDLEREVPFELYPVVAEIMAWAVNLKRLPGNQRARVPEPADLQVPEALRADD
ncbi:flagellar type III secretion system protein FlhB [Mangrovimicrobium sediminis]|uniref:Flagellar biosynthetic protein FlhB n=1 Tax=Mangrovimicrobium sediminis TaxID=2562682 RepID=A0A4Z0LUG1_9GAMM|nr:flagellar biosynthesis protein FlhB [Haliea sp. SAOS-164]TGD70837.1 flagellar type III secretion system protein FlhB [Haliea sp. SAOS-164]